MHNLVIYLRKVRKHLFIVLLIAILLILLGFLVAIMLQNIFNPTVEIQSSGTIVFSPSGTVTVTRAPRYVHLDVSPLAFPTVGQSWKIFVYSQNKSSDNIVHYSPLPNATITVTAKVGSQTKIYSIASDNIGHAEFQFLSEYTDIAFQASLGENKSDSIVITQHYVPADTVDFVFVLSGVMSPITGTASTFMFHFKKKVRVIFSLLVVGVFCLSLFQLVISAYSKFFLETAWGYPENIFSFITWTVLRYASLVGIILFAILGLLAVFLKPRNLNQKNAHIK